MVQCAVNIMERRFIWANSPGVYNIHDYFQHCFLKRFTLMFRSEGAMCTFRHRHVTI